MKNKTMALALGLALGVLSFNSYAAPAPGEEAGFEEFPIGDDQRVGPLNVAGVYFQPVDMEPAGMSLSAADSDIHIEADISAAENDLGYGVGDFVPYLRVDYSITSADSKKVAAEGTFMAMNASDGPHYGANIKLPEAGTYTVRFVIHSPEEQGYLLHVDKTTGVKGHFWKEPLVVEWKDFKYVPRKW
ncbi:MAG: iron transporter [Succinivibrio sp.]